MNRFAVPLEALEAATRVPVSEQVPLQDEARAPEPPRDPLRYGDGATGGDADGD